MKPRITPALFGAIGVIGLLLASCATADTESRVRDVVVGKPVWFGTTPRPEKLPDIGIERPPAFPVELYATAEIGYVGVTCTINSGGTSFGPAGTNPAFENQVARSLGVWRASPARLPDAQCAILWIPVIFNPTSAAPGAPNATPRLVSVVPIVTPRRVSDRPHVLRVKLNVDANGAVIDIMPEEKVNPANLPAIREAVQQWRFTPARQNGHSVAAEVVVPILCQAPPRSGPGTAATVAPATNARPIKRVPPEYPSALRRAGVSGHAIVDFDVDVNGDVRDAIAVSATDPAFAQPAVAAISQWKFEPARRADGHPVEQHQRVPVVFGEGDVTDELRRTEKAQEKLPTALPRTNTPPIPRSRVAPVYPYALRRDGIAGKATVEIKIDLEGRVTETKIVQADRPEFGRALAAALENLAFQPAIEHGKAIVGSATFTQDFDAGHMPDNVGSRLIATEQKHPESIPDAATLTPPLHPLAQALPHFPLAATTGEGNAMIECFVLENGRAHVPRIISASDDLFGYAAVQAVTGWSFDPPSVNGKPVTSRVRIAFQFDRHAVTATIQDGKN